MAKLKIFLKAGVLSTLSLFAFACASSPSRQVSSTLTDASRDATETLRTEEQRTKKKQDTSPLYRTSRFGPPGSASSFGIPSWVESSS